MERAGMRVDLARLSELAAERGVALVLVGNPLHMDGSEGSQSAWARDFAERLRGLTGLAVRMWDERLTTVEAERVLRQSGISQQKRSAAVDRLAAVVLLQSYLDSVAVARGLGDEEG
jgi:putative Holliday junction resolvase